MNSTDNCPCGSGAAFGDCCARFIEQSIRPQTAEQLMRSRFSAYVIEDYAYLEHSWHPDTCPDLSSGNENSLHWTRLEVVRHKNGLKKAIVEFNAYYLDGDSEHCMHEVSEFRKVKNRWVYYAAITAAPY